MTFTAEEQKWDASRAYAVVRDIIATDPALVQAVVAGITAGFEAKFKKLQEELSWSNMAMDMALAVATKRATPGTTKYFNFVMQRRLERWGENHLNASEREWLAANTVPTDETKP